MNCIWITFDWSNAASWYDKSIRQVGTTSRHDQWHYFYSVLVNKKVKLGTRPTNLWARGKQTPLIFMNSLHIFEGNFAHLCHELFVCHLIFTRWHQVHENFLKKKIKISSFGLYSGHSFSTCPPSMTLVKRGYTSTVQQLLIKSPCYGRRMCLREVSCR